MEEKTSSDSLVDEDSWTWQASEVDPVTDLISGREEYITSKSYMSWDLRLGNWRIQFIVLCPL